MPSRYANQPESTAQRAERMGGLLRAAQQAGYTAGKQAHPGNNPPYNLQQDVRGARSTTEKQQYLKEYRAAWIKGMTEQHARYGDAYWSDQGYQDGKEGYAKRFDQVFASSKVKTTVGQRRASEVIYHHGYQNARIARLRRIAEKAAVRDYDNAVSGVIPVQKTKVMAPWAQSQYESNEYWKHYHSIRQQAMNAKNGLI